MRNWLTTKSNLLLHINLKTLRAIGGFFVLGDFGIFGFTSLLQIPNVSNPSEMAEKKKQHYVPKFYLKNFSNGNLGTHLGVFIKNQEKVVEAADLKNQAYENFFYGKDGIIENAFSEIENKAASVFNSIITTGSLPKKNSQEYQTLWIFTLLQTSRTKLAIKEKKQMLNSLVKTIFKHDERFKTQIEEMDFEFKNPTAMNLTTLIDAMHVAKDLDCKLIINNTKIPFITSDSPVWKYNQFLEDRNYQYGTCGLASKGLKIFYPLTPKLLLLLYDSKVYKINFRKRSYIETNYDSDITQINLLQMLNSDEVIFYNEKVSADYLKQLYQKSLKFDLDKRQITNEMNEEKRKDGTSSVLLHHTILSFNSKLNLSFLKYSDHAKYYKMNDYVVQLRDENLRNQRTY